MRLSALASIRVNLILLVLVAVLPALAILLFSGSTLRETLVRSTENNALRQVQAMAAHHERVVGNARLLLASLARAREVQALDAASSQKLLEEMRRANAAYAVLSLANTKGAILAISGPPSFAETIDNELFQRASQEMDFVMGSYHLVPETRHVVIDFAQPVPDQQGRLRTDLCRRALTGRLGFYPHRCRGHAPDPLSGNGEIHLGAGSAPDDRPHVGLSGGRHLF